MTVKIANIPWRRRIALYFYRNYMYMYLYIEPFIYDNMHVNVQMKLGEKTSVNKLSAG